MNGALKAAWALTVFVVLAGIVLWLVTGRNASGTGTPKEGKTK